MIVGGQTEARAQLSSTIIDCHEPFDQGFRTIVAVDRVGLFFWRRKENEIVLGNSQKCLRQWSVWNFWGAINEQCVTRVGAVFLVKLHGKHLPGFFISGQ